MPHLLKIKDERTPQYLGPAKIGNLRGPLCNAYAFKSYNDASWLRGKFGLKSKYSIEFITEKELFAAKLKGK